ncbi:MAG: hypothetical protein D6805_08730 [Planctomycetota bacterium]|nr:MAG: hypothetical protein D6805_08730 [Planctomycetota bacterium]
MKLAQILIIVLGVCLLFGCQAGVEYSKQGVPVCPYCKEVVAPHTEFCYRCKKFFRYTSGIEVCWHCEGEGYCPSCHGSGKYLNEEKIWVDCQLCRKTGLCYECRGEGYIVHGAVPVKIDRFELERLRANEQ